MTKTTKLLALLIFLASWLTSSVSPAAAAPNVSPEQLAAQIVSGINAYRQANGFSTLPVNASLASLATTQSEYQASIQTITHTGPGGTTPKERAAAYGYAGGGTFFMSEIIYGGQNATPASAINWWKNSPLHNSVLLDKRYAELGAGVAYNGERVYFTVELAWTGNYIAYDGIGGDSGGNVNTGTGASGSGTESDSNSSSGNIPEVVSAPISRAAANPDGSIVHIVQAGQDLWTIAAVYQVDLQVIYQLNGMSPGDYIYPGNEIIIQPPTAQATPTITPTNTPTNTATALPPTTTSVPEIGEAFSYAPAVTSSPVSTQQAAVQPNQTAVDPQTGNTPAKRVLIASLLIIVFAVVWSMFLGRPPKRPSGH